MKSHLKRLDSPKTWHIDRKTNKMITKPLPGPHNLNHSISLNTALKEVLAYATTSSESRKILSSGNVKIDGKLRKNPKFSIGLFDTLELTGVSEHFRMTLNRKGKLNIVKIGKDEVSVKPAKIIGKTMVKGKLQLNLYDGKNIMAGSGDYNVGDTLLLSLPDQKINKHFKLDKKSAVFLTGGKHTGELGNVEQVILDRIIYKDENGNKIETAKKYAYVIGDEAPSITVK